MKTAFRQYWQRVDIPWFFGPMRCELLESVDPATNDKYPPLRTPIAVILPTGHGRPKYLVINVGREVHAQQGMQWAHNLGQARRLAARLYKVSIRKRRSYAKWAKKQRAKQRERQKQVG